MTRIAFSFITIMSEKSAPLIWDEENIAELIERLKELRRVTGIYFCAISTNHIHLIIGPCKHEENYYIEIITNSKQLNLSLNAIYAEKISQSNINKISKEIQNQIHGHDYFLDITGDLLSGYLG